MVVPDEQEKIRVIVEAALELKAEDVVVLDMRKLTSFADTFVLLGGRSERQVRAISDHIVRTLKAAGDPPLGVEGVDEGLWVLIDCNDVIVHAFEPETRERYSLDRLWHDAPKIEIDSETEEDIALVLARGPRPSPPRGDREAEEKLA